MGDIEHGQTLREQREILDPYHFYAAYVFDRVNEHQSDVQFFLVNSLQAAPVTLVNSSDNWYVHKGTNAPQADWKTVAEGGLDPATWFTSQGGFGYSADNPGELVDCHTLLSDMQNRYTTVYLRRNFEIASAPATNLHLMLRMDWDDGFIASLDGIYLTNMFVTGAPTEPGNLATANSNHESSRGNAANNPQPVMTFDLGEANSLLSVGTHTFAILALNVSSGSSDFVILPELYLDVPPEPPSNALSGTAVNSS